VSSLKIPLYNIPDVDETFSIGALWRQCSIQISIYNVDKGW